MSLLNYIKQIWDTTSYVNPTRMNHIEDGIYNVSNKVDNLSAEDIAYSSGVSVKDKFDATEIKAKTLTKTTTAQGAIGLELSSTTYDVISAVVLVGGGSYRIDVTCATVDNNFYAMIYQRDGSLVTNTEVQVRVLYVAKITT